MKTGKVTLVFTNYLSNLRRPGLRLCPHGLPRLFFCGARCHSTSPGRPCFGLASDKRGTLYVADASNDGRPSYALLQTVRNSSLLDIDASVVGKSLKEIEFVYMDRILIKNFENTER